MVCAGHCFGDWFGTFSTVVVEGFNSGASKTTQGSLTGAVAVGSSPSHTVFIHFMRASGS